MVAMVLQASPKMIRVKGDKPSEDRIREEIIKEEISREDRIRHNNALMDKHLLVSLILWGPTDQL